MPCPGRLPTVEWALSLFVFSHHSWLKVTYKPQMPLQGDFKERVHLNNGDQAMGTFETEQGSKT